MAKIAKSKDTANYRKGNALQVGDTVAVWIDGVEVFTTVTAYLGKVPYMGTTNHEFETEAGKTLTLGGGEFQKGRY